MFISQSLGGMRGRKVSSELFHPWVRRFYTRDNEGKAENVYMLKVTDNCLQVGLLYSYHPIIPCS